MALLLDPFDALSSFQQALDAYRASSWLDPGISGLALFLLRAESDKPKSIKVA